jgi:hypothetical protein
MTQHATVIDSPVLRVDARALDEFADHERCEIGRTALNAPPYRPTGVRTASTTTARRMAVTKNAEWLSP